MEEFQKVLDQVIDHSLPESEKSPLVQKLNLEHAKEDNCLEDVIKQNKSKFKSLNKKTNRLNNLINDKMETNCQSSGKESHLQKLESYCETFVNNNCQSSTSFTNSILSNCNQVNNVKSWESTRHKTSNINGQLESSNLNNRNSFINKTSLESSQKLNINHYENSKQCCDNSNCDCIKRQKSRLLYNVSNTTEDFEFKDYSRRAQLVEYSPSLKYADLKENSDYDDHKLEPLINKTKDLKASKLDYFDQANQLKYNLVNTQFAEKVLGDELKDNSDRNYSSDCLNRCKFSEHLVLTVII